MTFAEKMDNNIELQKKANLLYKKALQLQSEMRYKEAAKVIEEWGEVQKGYIV